MTKSSARSGRRWIIRGRVQGVGFRQFAAERAREIGVSGYVRNLSDGSVEVIAGGTAGQLDTLAGYLSRGPRFGEVRAMESVDAAPPAGDSFLIRY